MIAVDIRGCGSGAGSLVLAPALRANELDEASRFRQEDVEFLASRELVYLTSLRLDPPSSRMGTIVAGSHAQAIQIASARGRGEKILGLMGQSFLRNMKMWLLARL